MNDAIHEVVKIKAKCLFSTIFQKNSSFQKYEDKNQDRENFHGYHDLPFSAVVDRKKGDPDTEEHQHTE